MIRQMKYRIKLILALGPLLCGCTTVREVPVETVIERTDTVERVRVIHEIDSVRVFESETREVRDSVAPILDSLQNLIGWERWHWESTVRYLERDNTRLLATIDSLRQAATDKEVREKPVRVTETVEANRLRWWQTALCWVGSAALTALLGMVIWRVRRK